LEHEFELGELLVDREVVALARRGEAALRGEAELIEVGVLRGLRDAGLEELLGLEVRALRGDEAEHDGLALRQVAQRLEDPPAPGRPTPQANVDLGEVEEGV